MALKTRSEEWLGIGAVYEGASKVRAGVAPDRDPFTPGPITYYFDENFQEVGHQVEGLSPSTSCPGRLWSLEHFASIGFSEEEHKVHLSWHPLNQKDSVEAQLKCDLSIYGNAFEMRLEDGTSRRIAPDKVTIMNGRYIFDGDPPEWKPDWDLAPPDRDCVVEFSDGMRSYSRGNRKIGDEFRPGVFVEKMWLRDGSVRGRVQTRRQKLQ